MGTALYIILNNKFVLIEESGSSLNGNSLGLC